MKTTIKFFAILALALGTFGQHSIASAATIFNFKEQGADAFFVSVNGCVRTDVYILAGNGRSQNPPGPGSDSTSALIQIFQNDTCNQELLLAAHGFAWLDESAFQISREMDSAALNVTMNVLDSVSGSSFDVDVDLTWTATGPLVRRNDSFHSHAPGCNQNSHQNVTGRSAEASGSVSNDGTNFTPVSSGDATTFEIKGGGVTAGCN